MKRVYLGNTELTALGVGGGGGDDTQKWVDYFNGTLTEFTVPEGVTTIKESAFYGCSNFTDITIPNSVTSIGTYAFYGCSNLTDITIPDKVTFIDYGAFGDCAKLKTMTVEATTPPTLAEYAIPDETTTIYVPASSVNTYKSASGWKDYASKIKAIPKKETVVTYSDGTTKEFDIKGELTSSSIENKNNATKAEIGNGVTIIGNNAFNGCEKLTGVTLPDSLTNIGYSAFMWCTNLTGVTIPNTVTNIDGEAFNACSSLISVIVKATVPPKVGWNPIQNNTNLTIHVPAASVDAYKSASGWSDYADKIHAIL